MSRNVTPTQAAALAALAAKARLVTKNKEAAREHLLRIQLLLARKPINVR